MKKIILLTLTTLLLLFNCSSTNTLEGEFKCNNTYLISIIFEDSSYANFLTLNEEGTYVSFEFEYSISDEVITFKNFNEIYYFKVEKDKLQGLFNIDHIDHIECIKE